MSLVAPPEPLLSYLSPQSLGPGPIVGVPASAAWPANNRVIYIPFWLLRTDTVRKLWWLNGGTASGNVEVGVYRDSAGLPTTRIFTSGSTAQGTINVVQEVDITDVRLDAGAYWMAATMSTTAGFMFRIAPAQTGHMKAMGIVQETPGTFGLPATATPIVPSSIYVPMFGLAFRTLVA